MVEMLVKHRVPFMAAKFAEGERLALLKCRIAHLTGLLQIVDQNGADRLRHFSLYKPGQANQA